MGMEKKFEIHAQLYETRQRFHKACDQIVLLGAKLGDLNQRYNNAKDNGNQVFRHSLRLRMLTIEGLVKTFTHYACMKKNEIMELQTQLSGRNSVVLYWDTETEDDNDDVEEGSYTSDED